MESGRIRTAPQRNFENNCQQIFNTKELLNKIQNTEVGPKYFELCGYELHIRQISVLIALFILFVASCSVGFIFWGTSIFQNAILSKLVISNESEAYQDWVSPTPTRFHIYIFNYTNVENVEAGYDDKLNVNELGPFIYEDRMERVNVKFSDDGNTVKFQEKHTFKFLPHLSKGRRQNDRIVVPNMPLLSAAAMSKDSFYLTRMAMSGLFRSLNAHPFVTLPIDRFVFGYDDDLYNLAKGVLALTKPLPFEKFGLLANRNGIAKDVTEIYTGKDDINKVGTIKSMAEKANYDHWLNEDCNNVDAVEGVLFSPKQIHNKAPVELLYKDICRKMPYSFEKEIKIMNNTIKAYRYTVDENVYGHPSIDNPSNQCYCDMEGGCPPHGLFNATKCAFGTPLFISKPHFYQADPSLFEAVTGLNPNPKNHQSFIDIHPFMSFTTQGWTRVQTNIQVKKSFGITQLSMFEDDMFLPIAWMEFGVDAKDLSDKAKQVIYDSTYLVNGIDMAFKIGSLLMGFITLLSIVLVIRGRTCRSIEKLGRTMTGESRLIATDQ